MRAHPLHLKYVMEDALQRRKNIRIMADNTSDNRLQITKLPVNETLIWTQIGNMHFRIYIHIGYLYANATVIIIIHNILDGPSTAPSLHHHHHCHEQGVRVRLSSRLSRIACDVIESGCRPTHFKCKMICKIAESGNQFKFSVSFMRSMPSEIYS